MNLLLPLLYVCASPCLASSLQVWRHSQRATILAPCVVDDTWLSAENSPGRTIVRFRASLGDIGFPADDNVLVRSDNHPVFPTP